jgi:hypothetical protein
VAPAAVPAVAAATPPAPRVAILFESDPPGAQTRRVGEGELIGITPFSQVFESGVPAEFELRMPGYEPQVVRVELTADSKVRAQLHKVRARSRGVRPATPPRRAPASKEATLDPFAR